MLRSWAERLGGPASDGFAEYVVSVIAFTLVLFAIEEVLGFPLSYYRGFAIEHRYGLSRESFREWMRDHAKATAVGVVFSLVAAVAVYAGIYVTPTWWWLIAAVLATDSRNCSHEYSAYRPPPAFYRLEPLDRAALRDRLVALADAQGIRAIGVFVWGLGEKTRKATRRW